MTETTPTDAIFDGGTIPSNLCMAAQGFAEDYHERARAVLQKIHSLLSAISQQIDLSALDGVTIAVNYDQALADLDRGYETSHVLTATSDVAIGIAMTPRVIRNGALKSHIVLNAAYVIDVLDENGEELEEETDEFGFALHLLAHESGHVEVTEQFNRCFPDWLLQRVHPNVMDNLRWQVILATWEEYAVCRLCGDIGHDPTPGYAETFQSVLDTTHQSCVDAIIAYRTSGDVEQVIFDVYGYLGNLLKYASYFLGALHGTNQNLAEYGELNDAIETSWFQPYFARLINCMDSLHAGYGGWDSTELFEAIGDLVEQMAEEKGIYADRQTDEQIYFDIPHASETMPAPV